MNIDENSNLVVYRMLNVMGVGQHKCYLGWLNIIKEGNGLKVIYSNFKSLHLGFMTIERSVAITFHGDGRLTNIEKSSMFNSKSLNIVQNEDIKDECYRFLLLKIVAAFINYMKK